jgi:type II secretory pathway pseudopilin PulG
MKYFLLGFIGTAVVFLWVNSYRFTERLDALQLQINLLSNQVDRDKNCPQGIAVLSPGEDFYHPKTVMICQR